MTASSTAIRGRRDADPTTTISLSGGRRLRYAAYGRSDGTPVLFLHGTPGSYRLGSLFDAAARERGVRLIAPDRPGYGGSTAWSDRTISDADRYLRAILDDANVQRAGLIAFSGGAPHALAMATQCPDIVSRIDLVAGATPPDVTGETPTTQRLLGGLATRTPTLLAGLLRGQAWLAERLDPSFVVAQYTAGDADESVSEEVATTVEADFLEALAHTTSGTVTDLRTAATEWALDYEALAADVRLWHGTADTNVPIASVRAFEDRLPTATIETVDGADHLRTLLRAVPAALEEYR
ncbi:MULTISPECIES: alpha/beta fold hydrolase [Halomicrobium]|uniref:Alpha/beta hydrolase fold protein n=2 Tax=Halomicrobium mukohataei TaxID=57705 RepID=C7P2F2_HALMD|nr:MULTISPECIES: alpha/beta hydrolase [Halomicrobium]ACV49267.1 alpha/beta hydrolase fold protein [Halomicrobium mukohataei DSM 12286]QCD64668.1 alpha/beta hydrolase [Halomicrobium mukohataei]QFR19475.1 alpha/beta fold hydrolase [Halomicrobium sp. ZPS1]